MSLVNELFQNVRFLKFYGWGRGYYRAHMRHELTQPIIRISMGKPCARRTRDGTEVASQRQYCFRPHNVHLDVDPICHRCVFIPMLHDHRGTETHCREGIHLDRAVLVLAGAYDRASWSVLCPITW